MCWIAKAIQTIVHIPPHRSQPIPKKAIIPPAAWSVSICDYVAPGSEWAFAAPANQKNAGMTVPSNEKNANSANP